MQEITMRAARPRRGWLIAALGAGWREIPFDGHGADGNLLASGVYFYRIQASGQTITRKMVIAR